MEHPNTTSGTIALSAPPAPVALTREEARELTDQIKAHVQDTFTLLLYAYQRKVWDALGYASWRAYATAELDISQGYAYRLLNHAMLLDEIKKASDSPIGENLQLPEGLTRHVSKAERSNVARQIGEAVDRGEPAREAAARVIAAHVTIPEPKTITLAPHLTIPEPKTITLAPRVTYEEPRTFAPPMFFDVDTHLHSVKEYLRSAIKPWPQQERWRLAALLTDTAKTLRDADAKAKAKAAKRKPKRKAQPKAANASTKTKATAKGKPKGKPKAKRR